MKAYLLPAPSLPRVVGTHEQDWISAIKSGTKSGADFSYSGPLTELVLLGNIAKRLDRKLYWDGKNMKFVQDLEADKYVRSAYRQGWSL
jgi:hypothetical protein